MQMRYFLLCTMLVASVCATAQRKAKDRIEKLFNKDLKAVEGYVVTNDGDTLHGILKLGAPSANEVKIRYYASESSRKKIFKSKDLISYAYKSTYETETGQTVTDWIHHIRKDVDEEPVMFGPTTVLMHQEVDGVINLYNYYIERNTNIKNPYQHCYYLEKIGKSGFIKITDDNFERVVARFFKEFKPLSEQVGTAGHRYQDLPKMVKEYNDWMQNQTATASGR